MSLQFDLECQRLVTGSYDKTIHIWDLRKIEEPRRALEGHSAAVFAVKFDMSKLISGSFDKTVRIWSYQ
jgi:F-box/WD-40 domain protein MET30